MQPLKVTIVPVTPFAQNCSIVACTVTNRAAIVDPGGDMPRIREAIDKLKVAPEKILLTHGHIDHAGAAADLAEALSLPIEGPDERDNFLLESLEQQGARFGITDVRDMLTDGGNPRGAIGRLPRHGDRYCTRPVGSLRARV